MDYTKTIDNIINELNMLKVQLDQSKIPTTASRWIKLGSDYQYCGECGMGLYNLYDKKFSFCPYCGAKMQAESEDDK